MQVVALQFQGLIFDFKIVFGANAPVIVQAGEGLELDPVGVSENRVSR